jgi:hypothetical protein
MTLIKLSEDHYVLTDDSDISIGNIVAEKLLTGGYELFTIHTLNDIDRQTQKKITHSTQPESLGMGWMQSVQPLFLSEVKELLGVVDVEKRGEKKYPKSEFWVGSGPSRLYDENAKERRTYIEGYNQALEDNKERKYTEEDIIKMIEKSRTTGLTAEYLILAHQPQTEWEVAFVDGKLKLKS